MLRPSGDHVPETSSAGSNVKREAVPCFKSWIQMSMLLAFTSVRSTAAKLPSGEILGLASTPGSPTRPRFLPERSYQVRLDSALPAPVLYTTVPLAAAANEP